MLNEHPNVILICSEDHGPHFGCHGDPNARTPYLDRLAAAGVRFGSHHTTCAICSPGRASLLTGLYPHQNGQINLATSCTDFGGLPVRRLSAATSDLVRFTTT